MSEKEKNDQNQTIFKEEEAQSSEQKDNSKVKTTTGLEENVASLLCYILSFITGIIFLIIEKENETVRFHAMQSIITFASIFILSFALGLIPFIGVIISLLLTPVGFILWIFLMFKAYQGGKYKLPWIGDFAEEQVKKMNK